jgi:hypothetical protein
VVLTPFFAAACSLAASSISLRWMTVSTYMTSSSVTDVSIGCTAADCGIGVVHCCHATVTVMQRLHRQQVSAGSWSACCILPTCSTWFSSCWRLIDEQQATTQEKAKDQDAITAMAGLCVFQLVACLPPLRNALR